LKGFLPLIPARAARIDMVIFHKSAASNRKVFYAPRRVGRKRRGSKAEKSSFGAGFSLFHRGGGAPLSKDEKSDGFCEKITKTAVDF